MNNDDIIDELRWVRLFTPIHIPKYLIEQVRDRDYDIDEFYRYQETACLRQTSEGPTLNPFSHLYALVDPDHVVKGFLWFVVDPLTKDLAVQTFSIDKEYWIKGKAVSKLSSHIKDIRRKGKLNKIYWVTNYPKHSERHGFKRSKGVLMEYNEEQENGQNINGWDTEGSGHRSTISRAEELLERGVGKCCAISGSGV
jgi:hypothetical protein